MIIKTTPGIVIQVRDHGESDKIVTFYCPVLGKLTGIAKGAKRSKKRFLNKLELFSLLEIDYALSRRSSLVRIDQAELLRHFPGLRARYDSFAAASLFCELIYFWTQENDGDQALFDLILWAFDNLEQDDTWVESVILFQVKLFSLLGYHPHLDGCMTCGAHDAKKAPYRFSLSQGGMVCNRCNRETGASTISLALNTANSLKMGQNLPTTKLSRLKFSKQSAKEALDFLRRYGTSLLQRDIQSWNHLPKI